MTDKGSPNNHPSNRYLCVVRSVLSSPKVAGTVNDNIIPGHAYRVVGDLVEYLTAKYHSCLLAVDGAQSGPAKARTIGILQHVLDDRIKSYKDKRDIVDAAAIADLSINDAEVLSGVDVPRACVLLKVYKGVDFRIFIGSPAWVGRYSKE